MAEWLYEAGIGEARAALVEKGRIVEMLIEPDDGGLRVGAVCEARLLRNPDASGRARVSLAGGEADLVTMPPGLSLGAALIVEVVREALPERGAVKLPRVRVAPAGAGVADGPDLLTRIAESGLAVRRSALGEDAFEAHGWSERLEEAASGIVAHDDALLRISLTPAMTLIDVDGGGPLAALAIAGARRSGEAIRCFGIAGSIGIDLPTLPDRAERLAAAAALDAVLPQPFERTAVNGFGFLQIIRRRPRRSLPELIAADPAKAAARALLRRAERTQGAGPVTLAANAAVVAAIEARPAWGAELARRIGAGVRLRAEPGLPISGGHAQREYA
ncbi:ribonuclease [Sphingomonas sp. BIUV-7]|uniref:Ribonuclease n=1 Tax=Sphingomonas natans TaxID=3063330 RepID=A0ABT8YC01_9SPHN|nr:ribonuclease [Sphingomonas sp. BIUV-7]MDO6415866.1 ribonuclease [Sphingomonas sp. BIUV-7]